MGGQRRQAGGRAAALGKLARQRKRGWVRRAVHGPPHGPPLRLGRPAREGALQFAEIRSTTGVTITKEEGRQWQGRRRLPQLLAPVAKLEEEACACYGGSQSTRTHSAGTGPMRGTPQKVATKRCAQTVFGSPLSPQQARHEGMHPRAARPLPQRNGVTSPGSALTKDPAKTSYMSRAMASSQQSVNIFS